MLEGKGGKSFQSCRHFNCAELLDESDKRSVTQGVKRSAGEHNRESYKTAGGRRVLVVRCSSDSCCSLSLTLSCLFV